MLSAQDLRGTGHTRRLLAVDWRAVKWPPSVSFSLTSANGPPVDKIQCYPVTRGGVSEFRRRRPLVLAVYQLGTVAFARVLELTCCSTNSYPFRKLQDLEWRFTSPANY